MPYMATPNWAVRQAAPMESMLDKAPPILVGGVISQMYERAVTEEDLYRAEAAWLKFQDKMIKTEKDLKCSLTGREGDLDIAKTLVDDLTKREVSLMIAIGKMIISFADQDSEGFVDALKESVKELVKSKGKELAKETVLKFKEALFNWMKMYLKKNRKHYFQVINDMAGIARGLGGITSTSVQLLFVPSKISPDECGTVKYIEKLRAEAFLRILIQKGELTRPPELALHKALEPILTRP